MALVAPSLISGRPDKVVEMLDRAGAQPAKVMSAATNVIDEWDLEGEFPMNSVLVIPLHSFLYPWRTTFLLESLAKAEEDARICGVVLDIDGPGGVAHRIDQVAEKIEKSPKPIATVVTGMMASAHFWVGTAAQKVFVASKLCEVGSVGTFTTFFSMKEYFKKNGIVERDIYPDTSDLKNKEYRALYDNDDDQPMKARLERLHLIFCEQVSKNLGIAYDPKLPLFRGEMFMADEAIENKIVDGYGSVEDAVKWVFARAVAKQANSLFN